MPDECVTLRAKQGGAVRQFAGHASPRDRSRWPVDCRLRGERNRPRSGECLTRPREDAVISMKLHALQPAKRLTERSELALDRERPRWRTPNRFVTRG